MMKAIRMVLVFSLVAGMMMLSASAFAQNGADLFKTKCAMCHGADGSKANAAMGIKPLSGADVQKQSDADLNAAITNGKGKMPAYKGKLTDEQIKSLVAHVRTLKK
jgi:mono/diheme cytochrome c family protein